MSINFNWIDTLSVGDPKLDAQHKQLLNQLNRFIEALVSEKEQHIIDDILKFLDKYVEEHFADEEAYMTRCKYPHIEEHKKYHREFVTEFSKIKQKYEAQGQSNVTLAEEIELTLGRWWSNHIMQEDVRYSEYCKKR